MKNTNPVLPVLALFLGASFWGIVWYPFRLLEQAGINGEAANTYTFFIALLLGLIFFHNSIRYSQIFNGNAHLLFWISFSGGWANIAYILAVLLGEVMRVLLLFYLAPLWTILFAWLLLKEKPDTSGVLIIMLSLAGAMIILWQPETATILPASFSDWLAILGGFMFALMNVLIRKDQSHNIYLKSVAIWLGVTLVGLGCSLAADTPIILTNITIHSWLLLFGIGIMMFIITVVLQYGITRIPANQAIVILLFEIFVAAVAAQFLTNETMSAMEWTGGIMIVSASLLASRVKQST